MDRYVYVIGYLLKENQGTYFSKSISFYKFNFNLKESEIKTFATRALQIEKKKGDVTETNTKNVLVINEMIDPRDKLRIIQKRVKKNSDRDEAPQMKPFGTWMGFVVLPEDDFAKQHFQKGLFGENFTGSDLSAAPTYIQAFSKMEASNETLPRVDDQYDEDSGEELWSD